MLCFRHALPEDLAPALQILHDAYTPIYEGFREQLGDSLYRFFYEGWQGPKEERITKAITGDKGFTAVLDGRVVGWGHWWPTGVRPDLAALSENAVVSDLRGQGLGRQIHEYLFDRMREQGFTHVRVGTGLDAAHTAARHAYAKVGFEKGLPSVEYHAMLRDCISGTDASIRAVRESDMEQVILLARRVWTDIHAHYAQAYLGEQLHDAVFAGWQERQKNALCQSMLHGRGYVHETDGRITGFISYSAAPERGYGDVGYNAVEPALRGQGIGGKLYAAIFDRMREEGLSCVRVHTGLDDAHAGARRAYQKAGFSHPIPHIDYYRAL